MIERLAQPGLTDVAIDGARQRWATRLSGRCATTSSIRRPPIEIRREIPAVLQAIGTPAAQYVLLESVLDSDTILRHRVITALNKLGQVYPGAPGGSTPDRDGARRRDHGPLPLVSGAGHARRVARRPAIPVVQGLKESMQQEAERIFRLLKILYPEHDMHSAFVGLQADDPVVQDNAMEFLETVLSPQLRGLLVPLFDRGVSPAQRGHLANSLLGASLGDREEAIAVMMLSQDPWLQSCAAYAIGEFRLTRFAAKLDRVGDHPDPLLRATAIDAPASCDWDAGRSRSRRPPDAESSRDRADNTACSAAEGRSQSARRTGTRLLLTINRAGLSACRRLSSAFR